MALNKKPVTGMKDIMPEEMAIRDYVIGVIKETYGKFGFTPIETPCMENIANLSSKQGGENEKLIFKVLKRGEKLNLETAKESLKDLINKEKNETITGETILKTVSEHMNISPDDIRSKKRSQDIATARQVVMYLCRKLTVMSLQSAGNIVGGRDHTTVINGINRVEAKRKEDPAFNNTIETIIKKLDTNA